MGSEPVRKYIGIQEPGYVLEEIDGVVHYSGLREDIPHFSEMMNVDGRNLDDAFLDGPSCEFRNVENNDTGCSREMSVGAEADDDDIVEPSVATDSADEVLGRSVVDEDVIVVAEVGGEGNAVFRIAEDSTIVVDDPSLVRGIENEVPEPKDGMEFELGEEFIAYVHRYASSVGFATRIYGSDREGGSRRGSSPPQMQVINNVLISGYVDYFRIRMCCKKQGKHKNSGPDPNRSVQTCRTGCMFFVTARRNPKLGNPWKITTVHNVHNHNIDVGYCRFLPQYRTISPADQLLILELYKANVKAANIYDVFVNKCSGYHKVPFSEVDVRNFLYLNNRKPLKDRDFAAMEVLFKKMKEESPGFFYDFEVDSDYRLKNVFWADARCMEAYKYFGDVVSFDTTFVSNRYRMPFATFVGVNHNGQTILFGCALIRCEDADSFVWLFETWKKCMGKAPQRILSDQDKAIGKAIAIVFPETTHRWCMWHVLKNCRKHLGRREDWSEMYNSLQNVLHDSFCVQEFEDRWEEWVNEYDVRGKTWVKEMYQLRRSWCPIYFKSDFWAGMSSTQRSEGMHHYFKGYVNVNTCLTDFVEKYGTAICRRIREEDEENFYGEDRHAVLTTVHPFEPIFDRLLTRNKFVEFHEELKQFAQNAATKLSENDSEVVYEVLVKRFRVGWAKKSTYRVTFVKESQDVKCECQYFEFRGILCAHALRVFWMEDVVEVPAKFVFERWRKDIPRRYVRHIYPEAASKGGVSAPAKRFHEIMKLCEEMGEMVMNDEELKEEVVGILNNMKAKIHEKISLPEGIGSYMKGTVGRVYNRLSVGGSSSKPGGNVVEEADTVKDPVDRRGRGKAPVKRKISFAENKGWRKRGGTSRRGGRGRGMKSDAGSSCDSGYVSPVKMVCRTWEPGTPETASNRKRCSFQMDCATGSFARS